MKLKYTLTAFAVALAALAQPTLADSIFTQNEKGEVTHVHGIPLPPIQTFEEAKAQAQKEIAAAKKEREAEQATAVAENQQSNIGNLQFFYTGKPYLEETGQFLFLFRHYDPELARWTTADPSGFPDGANNNVFVSAPTFIFDPTGLAWEYYNQFFGRQWETVTYVTIETNTSISLSGVSASVGMNSNGPTGSLTFAFSINTSSTVVNSSYNTTLTFAQDDPNPQGSGWEKVGNYTPTLDSSNTSKIVHNQEIGENRFRSMWHTTTEHVGYMRWQRWVE